MDYATRAWWATNPLLLWRVQMAIVRAAIDVTNEEDTTDNHAARAALARAVLGNPEIRARTIVWGVLNNANVGTGTSDPVAADADGDSALQFVVNQLWDSYSQTDGM